MAAATPKRSNRFIIVTGILLALLVLLAACLEFIARTVLPNAAAVAIKDQLDLPDTAKVEVKTSGFLLPQLVSQRLTNLTVTVPEYPLSDTETTTVIAEVGAVALDPTSAPLDNTRVSAELTNSQLQAQLLAQTGISGVTEVLDGAVKLETTTEIFNQQLAISAVFGLTAENNAITLTTQDVAAVPDQGADNLLQFVTPELLSAALPTQQICVAESVPAGFSLTELTTDTVEQKLIATFQVDPQITQNASLRARGSCQ